MQQPQRRYNQRHGNHKAQVPYEEKAKAMDFGAETDSDEDAGGPVLISSRRPGSFAEDDDGRQPIRVTTHPLLTREPAQAPASSGPAAASLHRLVRTRPVSAFANPSPRHHQSAPQPTPPTPTVISYSHWSTQSAVAKKAAANQKRPRQQQQQQSEADGDGAWRPRSSSESSFGRMFFGWRHPAYRKQSVTDSTTTAATTATIQQPIQYQGKNVHNFSYADAKIYSPHSYRQEAEQSKRNRPQHQQPTGRAKIWWTTDSAGAVPSVHSNPVGAVPSMHSNQVGAMPSVYSNQIMLARGAPEPLADYN